MKPPRQMDALSSQDRVLTDVSRALVAEGFDLPFPPPEVLLFHDQTEESDGDRARRGLKSADRTPAGPRRE